MNVVITENKKVTDTGLSREWRDMDPQALVDVLLGAIMGLMAWVFRREVKRADDRFKAMEKIVASNSSTLAAVQASSICQDDISELRSSITASINEGVRMLREDVERRHKENREDVSELRKQLRMKQ